MWRKRFAGARRQKCLDFAGSWTDIEIRDEHDAFAFVLSATPQLSYLCVFARFFKHSDTLLLIVQSGSGPDRDQNKTNLPTQIKTLEREAVAFFCGYLDKWRF